MSLASPPDLLDAAARDALVLDISLADIPMPSGSITSLAWILLTIRITSSRCPGMAGPDKSRKREYLREWFTEAGMHYRENGRELTCNCRPFSRAIIAFAMSSSEFRSSVVFSNSVGLL